MNDCIAVILSVVVVWFLVGKVAWMISSSNQKPDPDKFKGLVSKERKDGAGF